MHWKYIGRKIRPMHNTCNHCMYMYMNFQHRQVHSMGWRHETLWQRKTWYYLGLHLEINYILTFHPMMLLDVEFSGAKMQGSSQCLMLNVCVVFDEKTPIMMSCCEPKFVLSMNVIKLSLFNARTLKCIISQHDDEFLLYSARIFMHRSLQYFVLC